MSAEDGSDSDNASDVRDVHEVPKDNACNVLLKQFFVHHNITQNALSDLLELLNLYSEKQWPNSIYIFNHIACIYFAVSSRAIIL